MAVDLMGLGTNALRGSMDSFLGRPSGDPTGIAGGYSGNTLYGGDPTGIRGGQSRPSGFDPLLDGAGWTFGSPDFFDQQGQQYGQTGNFPGISAAGGNWAALDVHNPEIASAASKFGVPANLLKSMINRESSGDWGSNNRVHTGLRNQRMLPFVGIFEETANSWGLDFNSMIGNKQAQIDAMAKILSGLSSQYGGYDNAVKVYFGGPDALQGGFTDELGMDSNTYYQKAISDWQYLDSLSGSAGASYLGSAGGWGGGSSTSGVGSLNSIWGNQPANITFEFHGRGGPDLYGYGADYGLDGAEHTGIDIGLPLNSPIYAPMGGTVTCGGTGIGAGAGGAGCSAFNDVMGAGAGRIEVQLDNGAVLIFGHSSTSSVRPGQRVSAGQLIGTVGGMNGSHIHLEARVPDPSMPSGWRIVDPREVLGGSFTGSYGAAGPTTNVGGAPQMSSMSDLIYRYMMGLQ